MIFTPKKITFIINSLAGGGAERILSYILNHLDRRRFAPDLVLLLSDEKGYSLPEDIPVTHLSPSPISGTLSLLNALVAFIVSIPFVIFPSRMRKTFFHIRTVLNHLTASCISLAFFLRREQPDAVVVFLPTSIIITLMTLIAYRIRIPVCCSDRVALSQEFRNGYKFPWINQVAIKMLYKRADKYISVSDGVKDDLMKHFRIPGDKIVTIYNGIDTSVIQEAAKAPLSEKDKLLFLHHGITLIAVGRLANQKGYHDIITAFIMARKQITCRLIVIGEGELRGELEDLAESLGVSADLDFIGWQDNPFQFLAASDIFLLGSLYEGFPNVILEAMSLGLPVISTDCTCGPREILKDNEYGVLVPVSNPDALADAIIKLGQSETLRKFYSAKSKERVEAFKLNTMLVAYEQIFESLIGIRSVPRKH